MSSKPDNPIKQQKSPAARRVVIDLSGGTYEELYHSAKASGRSLRKEASIRIADHLGKFSIIGALGQTIPKKKQDI